MFSRSSNTLFLYVFFHYCIDARTTQYYLPLLATTICLIDLYLFVRDSSRYASMWYDKSGSSRWFDRRTFKPINVLKPVQKILWYQDLSSLLMVYEETRENSQRHISVRRTRETRRMKWRDIEIHISHFEKKHRGITTRPSAFTECCNHSCFSFFNYVGFSLITEESIFHRENIHALFFKLYAIDNGRFIQLWFLLIWLKLSNVKCKKEKMVQNS